MRSKKKNAQRIAYVAELAQIRQQTLPNMMQELGLEPVNPLQESAGQRLVKLAGTISDSDLDLMSQAIEEGCGRIDPNEW